MRILVADSGARQTRWAYADEPGIVDHHTTAGLNPNLVSREEIKDILNGPVAQWLDERKPERVYFYGSGLNNTYHQQTLRTLIAETLVKHQQIMVDTDLLAAAYACLGPNPGMVGILGQGSVAFSFDGMVPVKRKGGGGYLLGDEGGAIALGKAFLKRLINQELEEDLLVAHQEFSGLGASHVQEALYRHPKPYQFLSEQTFFLAEHIHQPSIRAIVENQFILYLEQYLAPLYREIQPNNLWICGGMVAPFLPILHEVCGRWDFHPLDLLEEPPIFRLVTFLQQNMF